MIYVIDNHGQFTHLIHRSLRDLEIQNKLVSNDLDVEDINEEADGVILSGGPNLNESGKSRKYVRELDIPLLGICLGHQLIADALDGKIGSGKSGGYAEIEIKIIEKNDLFSGFEETAKIWASHADEVKKMPKGFELLAKSDVCEIEAMYNPEEKIYGIQGHPEVAHTPNGNKILMNFLNQCDL